MTGCESTWPRYMYPKTNIGPKPKILGSSLEEKAQSVVSICLISKKIYALKPIVARVVLFTNV